MDDSGFNRNKVKYDKMTPRVNREIEAAQAGMNRMYAQDHPNQEEQAVSPRPKAARKLVHALAILFLGRT